MNRMPEATKHILRLEEIIKHRQKQLERYALRPNANRSYLEKENAAIQQLIEIYNFLLESSGVCEKITKIINSRRDIDPEAGHIILQIHLPEGNDHSIYHEIQLSNDSI